MFVTRPRGPIQAGFARTHGQAMVEYLVVTAVLAVVMFVPSALTENMSLADYLARAVRSYFRGYSFLLSVT